jgi:hypothetical protein
MYLHHKKKKKALRRETNTTIVYAASLIGQQTSTRFMPTRFSIAPLIKYNAPSITRAGSDDPPPFQIENKELQENQKQRPCTSCCTKRRRSENGESQTRAEILGSVRAYLDNKKGENKKMHNSKITIGLQLPPSIVPIMQFEKFFRAVAAVTSKLHFPHHSALGLQELHILKKEL